MAQNTLTYEQTNIRTMEDDNVVYMKATDIATALGYANKTRVGELYRYNKDEFSSDMVRTLESSALTKMKYKELYFSRRGAWLIAMFARTKQAKGFRKWVLDVLEEKVSNSTPLEQLPAPQTTTSRVDAFKALPEMIDMREIAGIYRNRTDLLETEAKNAQKLYDYLDKQMLATMHVAIPRAYPQQIAA